jgi:hypothetical protein
MNVWKTIFHGYFELSETTQTILNKNVCRYLCIRNKINFRHLVIRFHRSKPFSKGVCRKSLETADLNSPFRNDCNIIISNNTTINYLIYGEHYYCKLKE